MANKRTQYRANYVLTIGDRRIGRGETIWDTEVPEETYVRWDRLLARDHVTKVDEEPIEDDQPEEQTLEVEDTIPYNTPDEDEQEEEGEDDEPEGMDLSLLTRDVLLDRLEEVGVTEEDIEGSGSDGYVTKQDALVRAREELE